MMPIFLTYRKEIENTCHNVPVAFENYIYKYRIHPKILFLQWFYNPYNFVMF